MISPVSGSTGRFHDTSVTGGFLTTNIGGSITGEVIDKVVTYDTVSDMDYYRLGNGSQIKLASTYVRTWYDQSGNGNDLSQAVTGRRGLIAYLSGDNAGINLDSDSIPSIHMNGDDSYEVTFASTHSAANTVVMVAELESANTNPTLFSSDNDQQILNINTATGLYQYAGVAPPAGALTVSKSAYGTKDVYTMVSDTVDKFYKGNQLLFSGNAGSESFDGINIANNENMTADAGFEGELYEILVYKSNQEANLSDMWADLLPRYGAENNNLFVHTWFDQSGSGNHLLQNDPDKQPVIYKAGSGLVRDSSGTINIEFDGVDDIFQLNNFDNSIEKSIFAATANKDIGEEATILSQVKNAGISFGLNGTNTNNMILYEEDGVQEIHSISSKAFS